MTTVVRNNSGSDGKASATVWETRVRSLGWEEPLEKEMATHSSSLAWKIPWTEEPATVHAVSKSQTRLSNFTFPSLVIIHSDNCCEKTDASVFLCGGFRLRADKDTALSTLLNKVHAITHTGLSQCLTYLNMR